MGQKNEPDQPDGSETERVLQVVSPERRGVHQVLLVVYHQAGVETVPLTDALPIVVGREPPSQVVVADGSISRRHARFSIAEGEVTAEDLGSTNGTKINGHAIQRAIVRPGDEVTLGAVTVSVHALAGAWGAARGAGVNEAGGLIAESAAMLPVLRMVQRLASSVAPVLLFGETGTGKEELSRLIHDGGPRRDRPMIRINCGAIPASLVESTLFGHEKGAFTGAVQQQKGIFEAADGGSILLDEIGELPLIAQAALLRTLETKRVVRVGSTREIEVDVRVLAATHRDLEAMCREGTFRQDLFYRLNVVTLDIPPLRARREDIPLLAKQFLGQVSRANDRDVRGIDAEAMAVLEAHDWPGNIRELRNCIERAVVVCEGTTVQVGDLPARVREGSSVVQGGVQGGAPASAAASSSPLDRRAKLERVEVEILTAALREAGWNQTHAAAKLGMPLRTLQRKIRVLGIKRPT